jgi:acyl carrier protein
MELTKWIESEMNIEFSQSQLLGDDITTEDLINIIMDGSPATSAPVAAPVVKDTMASITPVVPTNFNVLPVEVHSSVDPLYQNISSIQKSTSMVTPDSVALKNEICDRLQNMLGLVDEKIDPAIPLRVYGLDSLTTMELTNWIQSELKVTLPQSQLLSDEITTNELVSIIINLLANNNNNNNGTNFYNAPSNNNSLDFNDVSNSKPVSSIADSESTFDASLVNQYNPAHETIITDDLLKKRSAFSGNKQELVRALKNEVVEKLQDLLGLVDENIDTNVPLQVYGLDSLTSMEIVKWVENDKKVELPQSALLSSEITTEELVNMIASKITGEDLVKAPSYDQYMDNELII